MQHYKTSAVYSKVLSHLIFADFKMSLKSAQSCGLQGLSVPFACVGFGDPVRVLCLYTMNTLGIL